MATTNTTTTTTTRDVLLYIPNLIGYSRVICTLSSFVLMVWVSESPSSSSSSASDHRFFQWWLLAISLYLASFVGDLFDGMAARKFRQTSTYGGLLDMVTDRCSTTGLLYILNGEYDARYFRDVLLRQDSDSSDAVVLGLPMSAVFRLLFLGLILLDISSHWCQMFSSASTEEHHKSSTANAGRFFLVRWYYEHVLFFGYCCVGAEFTYIGLYVWRHLADTGAKQVIRWILLVVCVPACVVKQVVNVSQLCSACYAVAACDAKKKSHAVSDRRQTKKN